MASKQRPNGYWNKERCLESAKKFERIADWTKAELGAYKSAHRNGWLEECTAHMAPPKNKKMTDAEYRQRLLDDGRGYVALEPFTRVIDMILHRCPEGHERKITPRHLLAGSSCPVCNGKEAPDYTEWLAENHPHIRALEPYKRRRDPILHGCDKGHQFTKSPELMKMAQTNPCHECSGHVTKLTTETYSAWLQEDGRGFVLLEPYVNNSTAVLHRCKNGHERKILPQVLRATRGDGCLDCLHERPGHNLHSHEQYVAYLDADPRGFVALENYAGGHTRIMHKCRCGAEFNRSPNYIKKGLPCGVCSPTARPKLTHEQYVARLEKDGRGIVVLAEYVDASTRIPHRCAEGHVFNGEPTKIMHGGQGCPECNRLSQMLTTNEYQSRLDAIGKGVVALDDYQGSHRHIRHTCSEGHVWSTTPCATMSGSGCPTCATAGSDCDALYFWEWMENGVGTGIYKPGVTSWRLGEERIQLCCRRNGIDYRLIALCQTSEQDAMAFESVLLNMGDIVALPDHITDGRTEFRIYSDEELGFICELLGVKEALQQAA